ncbi:MAG: 2Fe-2S iron-sulfur cluster-binding protein [Gammaproteobacteria bacterium]
MGRIRVVDHCDWRMAMPDSSLMALLIGKGVPLATSCGLGNCGTDMVLIVSGAENLSPIGTTEARTLAEMEAPDNARLACMARLVDGDIELEVPEDSLAA